MVCFWGIFISSSKKISPLFTNVEMLRRPLTNIELKLDDLMEYENIRREKELSKESAKSNSSDPPPWQPGPKSTGEVHKRIGYVPSRKPRDVSPEC